MKHSPIDDLYNELFGEYPQKAGIALERLATIAYNEICAQRTMVDQHIKGTYSGTDYQLDGLAVRNGQKEMIEAKDYSISGEKVGRDDIQKLNGALVDLDAVHRGVFASATDYTKPAVEYAMASMIMPHSKPIDLYQVRNSTELDVKGRIKVIHIDITTFWLDFDKGKYKPIFTKNGRDCILRDFPKNTELAYTLSEFTDKEGNVKKTIAELSSTTNKEVKMDAEQKVVEGIWDLQELYVRFPNGKYYEIARVEYSIPISVCKESFDITREGKACLLVKSQDGAINTLLTDKQLKQYRFKDDGSVEKG